MLFVGVDTHKSSLAVCVVDELGRQLAVESFRNERAGHRRLYAWVKRRAPGERRVGIESSGWLGHGLALYLLERGEDVRDVRGHMTERERGRLRGQGKSDPRDAYAIARVTAREQLAPVRTATVDRDLKLLCDYREQLLSERTRAQNRLHADLVTLHPGYEQQLPSLATPARLEDAERLLGREHSVQAGLARRRIERIRELDCERAELEQEIRRLVRELGTGLVGLVGVGELIAARIIGEVGDVSRIPSRRHFASLNGTAPIPASSGQRQRHRLNRGGNRRLNTAIHMMALTQARMDPRARAYMTRRLAEGRSRRDASRALKRHLSDVVYQQLRHDAVGSRPPETQMHASVGDV
ncbi:MAG TPA: IS110 family transposase [Gaiellaceae bacterium]